MTALPYNMFGYPPATLERARERDVHPGEIQEMRDDYFQVVFPHVSPYRMVSALGRGGLNVDGFYEPTHRVALVGHKGGMYTYACIEAVHEALDEEASDG